MINSFHLPSLLTRSARIPALDLLTLSLHFHVRLKINTRYSASLLSPLCENRVHILLVKNALRRLGFAVAAILVENPDVWGLAFRGLRITPRAEIAPRDIVLFFVTRHGSGIL